MPKLKADLNIKVLLLLFQMIILNTKFQSEWVPRAPVLGSTGPVFGPLAPVRGLAAPVWRPTATQGGGGGQTDRQTDIHYVSIYINIMCEEGSLSLSFPNQQ